MFRGQWNTSNERLLAFLLSGLLLAPVGAALAQNCLVGDTDTLANCIAEANQGQINRIEITRMIACDSPKGCAIELRGINQALAVVGSRSAGEAGFRRMSDIQTHYGLRVIDSTGPVTISDLVFDEGPNIPTGVPGDIWLNASCSIPDRCDGAALSLNHSTHVTVERTTFADAKYVAVAIAGSSDVTIRHDRFLRSWLHGIWLSSSTLSSDIRIQDNEFTDIRSNAIMFSGTISNPTASCGYNLITRNLFRHNHYAAHYHVCGPDGHQPCAGGQIDVEQHSDHVLIAGNRILDGRIDEDPSLRGYGVSGVEVAVADIRDVIIAGNEFRNLSAPPIVVDRPGSTVAPIIASGNDYMVLDLGSFDEVDAMMQEGRRRQPHDEHFARGYAQSAHRRGDLQEALRRCEIVRTKCPKVAEGYTIAADCLTNLGRHDEAEAMIGRGVIKLPGEFELLVQHARNATRRREWPEALERWEVVRGRFQQQFLGSLGVAQCLRELSRFAEAEQLLIEACAKFYKIDWLYAEFADLATAMGDLGEAVHRWEGLLKRSPFFASAYVKAAAVMLRLGREADADALLSVGVIRVESDLAIHLEYARSAERRGDWGAATKRWVLLRERFPDCDEARDREVLARAAAARQTPCADA